MKNLSHHKDAQTMTQIEASQLEDIISEINPSLQQPSDRTELEGGKLQEESGFSIQLDRSLRLNQPMT